jgi:hypothetical protein
MRERSTRRDSAATSNEYFSEEALMITEAGLTVANVRARAVNITLERPVQTSGGEIPTAPLVLIDLTTREGTTGHAYVFSYSPFALEPLRRLVREPGQDARR